MMNEKKDMFPHQPSILSRVERRPPSGLFEVDQKIVFLNAENLKVIECYKATVTLNNILLSDRAEIHIVLTGNSKAGAERLFDQLKAMTPSEINGR